jgi:hypothetical protein
LVALLEVEVFTASYIASLSVQPLHFLVKLEGITRRQGSYHGKEGSIILQHTSCSFSSSHFGMFGDSGTGLYLNQRVAAVYAGDSYAQNAQEDNLKAINRTGKLISDLFQSLGKLDKLINLYKYIGSEVAGNRGEDDSISLIDNTGMPLDVVIHLKNCVYLKEYEIRDCLAYLTEHYLFRAYVKSLSDQQVIIQRGGDFNYGFLAKSMMQIVNIPAGSVYDVSCFLKSNLKILTLSALNKRNN